MGERMRLGVTQKVLFICVCGEHSLGLSTQGCTHGITGTARLELPRGWTWRNVNGYSLPRCLRCAAEDREDALCGAGA